VRQTLEIQGSLVPAQGGSAKLTSQVAGRITNVFVKEGDRVVQGQLLARVDTTVQNAQLKSAQASAQAADSATAQARFGYTGAAADQAAALRTAELALEAAKLDRDNQIAQAQFTYETAGSDLTKTKSQTEQAIIQAQVARDLARTDFERNQKLAADGFVSKKDLDSSKAAFVTAESALQSAENAQGADIKAASLRLAAAKDVLTSARALGGKRVDQASAAVRQARAAEASVAAKQQEMLSNQSTALSKRADAMAAAANASLGEIRAPFAGRIVRRTMNPGDFADTVSPIVEVVAGGVQADFVGTATASDAARIRAGMEGEVDGHLGRVASVAPADPQTGLSAIRVIGVFPGGLGSFVTARIVLQHHAQATAIPAQALVDREGKTVVFRIVGDTAKLVEVSVIAEDAGFAEVTGLHPGDQLVKVGQFELSDGAKVKVKLADAETSG
ncbi:MAG: biotin/lipoyl-binding protein, partial [Fimbriimonadaceae bacterium]|nr:biotin/lipoyl-binding protein [Fimbriimonadaceae bacterium]